MLSSLHDNREFDLVIFGATGFTGYFVIRELLQSIEQNPEENGKIRWAVAGRNLQKLDMVLVKVISEFPQMKQILLNVVKICVNVDETESLALMARRTRLVINVVGPFGLYGKPVVEVCVQTGTDYIDISGEPGFNDQTYLDFNQKVIEQKSLIIPGCAFDCMASECGVQFVKDQFNGRLHSVESLVQAKFGPTGYKANTGTILSLLYSMRYCFQDVVVHRKLKQEYFKQQMPKSRIPLRSRIFPFKHSSVDGWNVLLPRHDSSVVEQTQYYNYHNHHETPVQYQTYIRLESLYSIIWILTLALILGLLSICSFTRNLLQKYPEFFTFGLVSNDGPSRDQLNGTTFTMYLFGRGWSSSSLISTRNVENDNEPNTEPDKTISVWVSGPDPGYVATSIFLVQSGLTILNDRSMIPTGGVLTPGSSFRSTKLFQRLESRNIKFTVLPSGGGD